MHVVARISGLSRLARSARFEARLPFCADLIHQQQQRAFGGSARAGGPTSRRTAGRVGASADLDDWWDGGNGASSSAGGGGSGERQGNSRGGGRSGGGRQRDGSSGRRRDGGRRDGGSNGSGWEGGQRDSGNVRDWQGGRHEGGSGRGWEGGRRDGGSSGRDWQGGRREGGSSGRDWQGGRHDGGSSGRDWQGGRREGGSSGRDWQGGRREGGSGRDWEGGRQREGGSGRRGWDAGRGDREGGRRRDGGRWRGEGGGAAGEAGEDAPPAKQAGLAGMWIGDVVYGVSPVLAALQAGRRQVHTLYLQEGMELSKRKDKSAIQAATRAAQERGARIEPASKHDLNLLTDNRPHQGLVLDASPLAFEPMENFSEAAAAWPGGSDAGDAGASGSSSACVAGGGAGAAGGGPPLWLCLDEVTDPQNFGAALRCAYFLGAAGVLACHRNSAPLTAVVSKASAGAMELMPVHACKSLLQTLGDARARGWQVLGAASEAGAADCTDFRLDRPSILVMGNEGHGLRTTVRRLCDAMLRIEGGAASPLVDSLNVSVATGVLLHQLLTSARRPA